MDERQSLSRIDGLNASTRDIEGDDKELDMAPNPTRGYIPIG